MDDIFLSDKALSPLTEMPTKNAFLADMSAKGFSLPPPCLNGHYEQKCKLFSLCIQRNIFFLKLQAFPPPSKKKITFSKHVR